MREIGIPFQFQGEIISDDEIDALDPPATPEEMAMFEDELRSIEQAELEARDDLGIILG